MTILIILEIFLCCVARLWSIDFEWTIAVQRSRWLQRRAEGNYPINLSICFFPLTRELEVLLRIIS